MRKEFFLSMKESTILHYSTPYIKSLTNLKHIFGTFFHTFGADVHIISIIMKIKQNSYRQSGNNKKLKGNKQQSSGVDNYTKRF